MINFITTVQHYINTQGSVNENPSEDLSTDFIERLLEDGKMAIAKDIDPMDDRLYLDIRGNAISSIAFGAEEEATLLWVDLANTQVTVLELAKDVNNTEWRITSMLSQYVTPDDMAEMLEGKSPLKTCMRVFGKLGTDISVLFPRV